MIVNFSVQNFGSIKDNVSLSFEATDSTELEQYYVIPVKLKNGKSLRILKLGLLYGANASGKTTLLRSLGFLRKMVLNPLEKKDGSFDYEPFLFDNLTEELPTAFSIEFIEKGIKYLYEVQLNKVAVTEEKLFSYSPNKSLIYERTTNIEKKLASISFGNKISLKKEFKTTLEANTLWNNTVLGGFQKTNVDFNELYEVSNWFGETLLPLVTPSTKLLNYVSGKIEDKEINKNNIISLLKKADFNISDVIFEDASRSVDPATIKILSALSRELPEMDKNKVEEMTKSNQVKGRQVLMQHIIRGNSFNLKYQQESAGTQRYYQLSGLLDLLIRKSKILPIDELECSLHPDLLKHFLLTFLINSKESQLIVSTHFRELLLERDIFRNDVIWFTERREDGSTDLYSLDDFDSSVIRNTSSVYNAYKIGKLGATPNLGDYYIELED